MAQSNRFSPSQLGDFESCPRAYWLARNHGVAWPRGIFPSLPGGIDGILKTHYDGYRARKLIPPEMMGQVPGKLYPDQGDIDRWRNWRTGLTANIPIGGGQLGGHVAVLSGALDDLLLGEDGKHYVFDAKTKGSPPKPGDTERYYGRQANCYALMLKENGKSPGSKAYFAYYHPGAIEPLRIGGILFDCSVVAIDVEPDKAADLVREAVACLAGPIPAPCKKGCEKCDYTDRRAAVGKKLRNKGD